MNGRWRITNVFTEDYIEGDAPCENTPVVPCDDAAVERAMARLAGDEDPEHFRLIVEQVFEAAGETT